MKYELSFFDDRYDTAARGATLTWEEFCAFAESPDVRAEKDGPLFSPATFDPPLRAKANAQGLSVLALDYDHDADWERDCGIWRAMGLTFVAYSTHSSYRPTENNPNAEERFRVVIALAEPIPAAEYPALWRWAESRSGGRIDKAAKDAGRILYLPAIAGDQVEYRREIHTGAPLDWLALELREAGETAKRVPPSQNGQRTDAYSQAALAGEVNRVRGSSNGNRNDALNKAAFALGQIVGAGALDAGEVEFSLLGAAVGAGLSKTEARRTIKSGMDAGEKEPRVLPTKPDASRTSGAQQSQSVQSGHSVQSPAQPEPWDLPVPFREFDLPAFPLGALPSWGCSFVKQLAEATQTPPDLAAMQSLSVIAATIARNVEIEARQGWREPLCLYTLTVLDSANRKSAVVSETTRPLERFEAELLRDARPLIDAAQNEYKVSLGRLEKAQKDCAKLSGEALTKRKEEARQMAVELGAIAIPPVPRLIVDDCTPETLASRLAEQGGRIALFSAEGGIFETMAGRYSSGVPNLDVFLKGHAGDSLRVDRRDRAERIERPALTIGVAVQGDVIRGLAQKPGFRGRGLLGRFLYSLPQSRLGARKSRAAPVTNEASRTYERYLIRLAAIKPLGDGDGGTEPILLRLAADADGYLAQFQDEIEPELAEGGEYATISEWAGKLCGAAVRLAGILHCADHAMNAPRIPGEVPADTFKRAVQIARYLIPHSLAAHAEMGADALIEDARYVLRWLARENLETATKREIHRGCRGRFKKITELDPVLTLLEDHSYLRALIPPKNDDAPRTGRKASVLYSVNPHFYPGGQNGQNGQNTALNVHSVHSVHSVHNPKERNFEPEPVEELAEDDAFALIERAAIVEFDGWQSRGDAEAAAVADWNARGMK